MYDLRTNKDFTLETNPLTEADLEDFLACYNPENRHERAETERFRAFAYDDLVKRGKTDLDIIWLRDDTLEDSASLPAPDVLAREIVLELQAALEQFAAIEDELAASA